VARHFGHAHELSRTELDDRVKSASGFSFGGWEVFDAMERDFDDAGKGLLLHDVFEDELHFAKFGIVPLRKRVKGCRNGSKTRLKMARKLSVGVVRKGMQGVALD